MHVSEKTVEFSHEKSQYASLKVDLPSSWPLKQIRKTVRAGGKCMRKVKYLFLFIILCFIVLFVIENIALFNQKQGIGLDLHFYSIYSPKLYTGIYYLAVFLIGLLSAYFSSLSSRFKAGKKIRQLNQIIETDKQRIAELESKLSAAARESAPARTQIPGAG